MANEFYDHTTYPSNGAPGSSSALRSELDAIESGFNKLPTLAGNGLKIVAINAGGTAMQALATTGTGNAVLATSPTLVTATLTSPTLVTPALGTPSSGNLGNCSNLQIGGIAGLAAGIGTFLATPSSSNFSAALTDRSGSGLVVFNNNPTLIAPLLGTPTSGTLTNCTGLPIATGVSGLGANVTSFLAAPTSTTMSNAFASGGTGSGKPVFATSPALATPTLTSPDIGVPSSGNLTNCVGFNQANLTGLGTGVSTFLGTPSSANLAAAITDETGTGPLVFANAPNFTAKFGYASGTGLAGQVTQTVSKSNAVTLNGPAGEITLNAAALAGDTSVAFGFGNSTMEARDTMIINHVSGGTVGSYTANCACGAGTGTITVRNITTGSLSEAIVLRYAIIRGSVT